jgi:hypothetical protein
MSAIRTAAVTAMVVFVLTAGTMAAASHHADRYGAADAVASEPATTWSAWTWMRTARLGGDLSASATSVRRDRTPDLDRTCAQKTDKARDCDTCACAPAADSPECVDSATCVTNTCTSTPDSCGCAGSSHDGKTHH